MTALCVLSACSGSSTDKPADSTAAKAAAVPATPTVVTVTAKDFAYDAPDTISSGMVTIRLVNSGPSIHHIQLLKLDDGHTVAELTEGLKHMKADSPPPPWVHEVAGPNTPVPGSEASITEEIAPGNYAIVCFIPAADMMPHAMKGMIKSLTVIPSTGAMAAAPTSDISVTMTDYSWTVTPDITAGKHVLKLENTAEQPHEMLLVMLPPGKKVGDLPKWVEKQVGPPPAKPMGGISGMRKGAVVYVPVDLDPGEYGLLCFLAAPDGKIHVEHGMMKQFTVK